MSTVSARLKVVDRVALAILCLILAAAVSTRFYRYESHGAEVADQTSDAVDLGAGVSLQRAKSVSQRVQIKSCTPATIYFVSPSWVGVGPSSDTSPDLNDRLFYAYRGSIFGGRFASMELIMVYVARLASGLLSMSRYIGATDLAVKIIVPAGCDATPDMVLVALRRQVQAR